MTGVRWVAALLGASLAASQLSAQGFIVPYSDPYYGLYGHAYHHHYFGLSLGGYYNPYCGPPSYGYVTNRVTVVITAPPPLLAPSRRFDLDDLTLELLRDRLLDDPPPRDLPPRGEQHFGGFRKVEPRGQRPAPPEQPKPAVPPLPPPVPPIMPPALPDRPKPPPVPPAPPPDLPKPSAPLDDPKAESARLVGLGRTAFADLEYGRAAERFRQAAVLAPSQPLPQFLLAETLFALGKYHDAVDAIRAGMKLQPDWPDAPFHPLDLYGAHAADYADHLSALHDALSHRPGDADLLFLDAYLLWFDGHKDEARERFQKALPAFAEPAVIQRFLRPAAVS
jgi:hypothetical protein